LGYQPTSAECLFISALTFDKRYRQSCNSHGQWDQWPGSVSY